MEIPGLGKVAVDKENRVIKVDKMQPLNKDTIDKLVALGL
jgi:simple sugar transport system substrate-binding protein